MMQKTALPLVISGLVMVVLVVLITRAPSPPTTKLESEQGRALGLVEGSHDESRSPQWEKVRNEWLKGHPGCAACGSTEKVNVHHIKPFHEYPKLELDPANLITLCGDGSKYNHHLHLGHLDSWDISNPHVVEWCKTYRQQHKDKE